MALPWMGKERDINAGNNEFMTNNTSNEMDLMKADLAGVMMNTQSCMDHSILAIFEDSTVASEDKIDVEEESESSLLTALTEILDSVEDDGGTLSPFDTLPDSEYLKDQKARNSLSEDRQRRPKLRSSAVVFTQSRDEEQGDAHGTRRHHGAPRPLKAPYQKALHCTASLQVRAERDVEIFASTSLVNLVRLMHPYCLQVHLEEDGKPWSRRPASSKPGASPALPSQGEILKYVKPSGDSDEDVDVDLLDDEAGDGGQQEAARLKSALVNREACRSQAAKEKKRVSFGPVQVTSIGEPEGGESDPDEPTTEEEEQEQTEALPPVGGGAAPAPLAAPAGRPGDDQANVTRSTAAAASPGQVKPKPLSLQQYRQLRQKREPLAEKQGNNTTKWPSLSEAPRELPPFLCLQGTLRTHRGTTRGKAACGHTSSGGGHHRRSKRSRADPQAISPAGPVLAAADGKPAAVSSDPPNPVLLPMPAARPAATSVADCWRVPSGATEPHARAPRGALPSAGLLHEIRKQLAKMERRSEVPTSTSAPPPPDPEPDRADGTGPPQGTEVDVPQPPATARPPPGPTTHAAPASETREPKTPECVQEGADGAEPLPKAPPARDPGPATEAGARPSSLGNCVLAPAPDGVLPSAVQEEEEATATPGFTRPEEPPPPTAPPGCGVFAPQGDSGIEATDLTSLLEQFEETQAKVNMSEQEGASESCSEDCLTLQTRSYADSCSSSAVGLGLLQREPAGAEPAARLPRTPPAATDATPAAPQTKSADIPSDGVPSAPSAAGAATAAAHPGAQDPPPAKQQWKPPPSCAQRRPPVKPKAPGARSIQIIDPQPLPYKRTQTQSPSKPGGAGAGQASQVHPSSSHVASDHDYCAPRDPPVSATGCSQRDPPVEIREPVDTPQPRAPCQPDVSPKRGDAPEDQRAASDPTLPADADAQTLPPGAEPDHRPASAGDRMKRCLFAAPPPSPPRRGREKETARRYRKSRRSDSGSNSPSSSSSSSSSCSSSSGSSCSPSPERKRFCPRRSDSSPCSSSSSGSCSPPRRYHFTYSRSRSKSWSQSGSRSRSRSPLNHRKRWRGEVYRSKESARNQRGQETRTHKLKAIDERRVVYVGRIRRTMTHDELRERFSLIGEVDSVSLHFRDRRDSYGFVTFHHMEDAFAAIENGSKLRRPDELPFDICFGGRRQFCKSDYADLDSTKDEQAHGRFEDLDFDSLLKQAQKGAKT